MVLAAGGCDLEVERGPDWLFVRPVGTSLLGHEEEFGDHVWQLLEQSMTHRVVLELDDVESLQSTLVEQLIKLRKKICEQGGLMRVCGLSKENQRLLDTYGLKDLFSHYHDRTEAIMASRPLQPR